MTFRSVMRHERKILQLLRDNHGLEDCVVLDIVRSNGAFMREAVEAQMPDDAIANALAAFHADHEFIQPSEEICI